ncbi:MAG: hypothetical protein U0359_25305 [Byssovorax sp.]
MLASRTLLLAAPLLLAACVGGGLKTTSGSSAGSGGSGGTSDPGTTSSTGGGGEIPIDPYPNKPDCDPSISVQASSSALIVTDPAVLAHFPLEKVLKQLLDLSAPSALTPLELLQRLFDTENTDAGGAFPDVTHCDTMGNKAFANGPPEGCPRAEGALAHSGGLLTPGDPDAFVPIALVNRFDLTPTNLQTCGEHRIVYAKQSGRTDPNDRVFLIFEGVLPSPSSGDLFACYPVAKQWASLEKETDPDVVGQKLEAIYFTGLPGMKPVIDPQNFGQLSSEDNPYGATRGQVRLSQRMQAPWEMRELHFKAAFGAQDMPHFEPATVKNNPMVSLFGAADAAPAAQFQSAFVLEDVLPLGVSSTVAGIRMTTHNMFNAGESGLEGPAGPAYLTEAHASGAALLTAIDKQLIALEPGLPACDPGDPLTSDAILARATTQTCAGCHAPSAFLGPARKIGCGLVWPDSLGGAHIDENGKLSPALTDVFLPRRASVLSTYLRACDIKAIQSNLQPSPQPIPD